MMGISAETLIELYPQLFHMAEAETWESIRTKGLLSTSALLDLFEIKGNSRFQIESCHRPKSVAIMHKTHGRAVIRDQIPMRENALQACLTDLTPQQWYETLNRRVFFWLTRERLLRLLSARAYRQKKHCVLTVDTRKMMEIYANKITLSPINSGSTIYIPQPRGSQTFCTLANYPFIERRKTRTIGNSIAELAVDYSVPKIEEIVIKVDHMQGEHVLECLYARD